MPGGGYRGIVQSANKCVEQGSWFDAHIWKAQWREGRLVLDPVRLRAGRTVRGRVRTPQGVAALVMTAGAHGVAVRLETAVPFDVVVRSGGVETRVPAEGAGD